MYVVSDLDPDVLCVTDILPLLRRVLALVHLQPTLIITLTYKIRQVDHSENIYGTPKWNPKTLSLSRRLGSSLLQTSHTSCQAPRPGL